MARWAMRRDVVMQLKGGGGREIPGRKAAGVESAKNKPRGCMGMRNMAMAHATAAASRAT